MRPLGVRSPHAARATAALRARAPEGGGSGSSPPTRARGRTPHAPLPPAVRPQCHCPFLAPSSPETQSVLCLSAHPAAARSHQLVCVPSHPALHTKETWARAASPPRTPERPRPSPAPPEERARERTPPHAPRGRPPLPPPGVFGVPHCPPTAAGWRGPAQTHVPLPRGVPSPRLQKRRRGRAC